MGLSGMFIFESSFRQALPADDDDKAKLFTSDDPSEFVFAGNGGYAFWDNGAYIDICVHVSPGRWETVDRPEQYEEIPNDVKKEYVKSAGSHWPAPGGSLKKISGAVDPYASPKKSGPSN